MSVGFEKPTMSVGFEKPESHRSQQTSFRWNLSIKLILCDQFTYATNSFFCFLFDKN